MDGHKNKLRDLTFDIYAKRHKYRKTEWKRKTNTETEKKKHDQQDRQKIKTEIEMDTKKNKT